MNILQLDDDYFHNFYFERPLPLEKNMDEYSWIIELEEDAVR